MITFASGCANKQELQNLEVQKRIGNEDQYESFKEITDQEQVQKALKIVSDVHWDNRKVDMARPADYQFSFPHPDSKAALYELWISPDKEYGGTCHRRK